MITLAEDEDEHEGSPGKNKRSDWDLTPVSGEGLATALNHLKRVEKARDLLRPERTNPGRESQDEGPSS